MEHFVALHATLNINFEVHVVPIPAARFRFNTTQIYGLGGNGLKNFEIATRAAILEIRTERC